MGSLAYRSLRKRSTKLSRPSKVTKSMYKMLVDLARNPVRDQLYEAQIQYHGIPIQKRQLQRKLKEHTNSGQRYKCVFVKKRISDKNKAERVMYAQEHVDKPIEDFWSYIFFTDEAHISYFTGSWGYSTRAWNKIQRREYTRKRREARCALPCCCMGYMVGKSRQTGVL